MSALYHEHLLILNEDYIAREGDVCLRSPDELSANLLQEQFVKDMSNGNFSAINGLNHWTRDEHPLQLITINEFNDQKDDDDILLVSDSCVKPICTDGDLFYACLPCKYCLHKACAELSKNIEHHIWPHKTLFSNKMSAPYKVFHCDDCHVPCNSIFFFPFGFGNGGLSWSIIRLHIGCATLPKMLSMKLISTNLNKFTQAITLNVAKHVDDILVHVSSGVNNVIFMSVKDV
ncbi:hypothetical protein POM88_006517 [Heracleum sosnowskyi]|uniref:Uncharacterized protein n=1 Tax=Heracleum sosnowskyi TaxID=360622 RepID=A0AAD8J2W3_9APIA|nr:hypothetical protein POM88_006517 [Heracleum sosnowskyi]